MWNQAEKSAGEECRSSFICVLSDTAKQKISTLPSTMLLIYRYFYHFSWKLNDPQRIRKAYWPKNFFHFFPTSLAVGLIWINTAAEAGTLRAPPNRTGDFRLFFNNFYKMENFASRKVSSRLRFFSSWASRVTNKRGWRKALHNKFRHAFNFEHRAIRS